MKERKKKKYKIIYIDLFVFQVKRFDLNLDQVMWFMRNAFFLALSNTEAYVPMVINIPITYVRVKHVS